MRNLLPALGVSALLGLTLSACATSMVTDADLTEGPKAADVIRQVKAEIGQFYVDFNAPISRPGLCTSGFIMKIRSANVQLATTATTSGDVNGGAQIPLLSGHLKGDATLATSKIGSATTSFTILPQLESLSADDVRLKGAAVWEGRPIYNALKAIRQSIIESGDQKPCMNIGAGSTVKLGFSLSRKASRESGFNIYLFALASSSREIQQQNTISVIFDAP
jgi:hypothetical protein